MQSTVHIYAYIHLNIDTCTSLFYGSSKVVKAVVRSLNFTWIENNNFPIFFKFEILSGKLKI